MVLLAVYFLVALYLHYSYVPKPDPPKAALLTGPFHKLDNTAYQVMVPQIDGLADFDSGPTRSTITVLEDGRPLGSPHSRSKVSNGSYTHWRGSGITNGRTYSVTWK
ncbi:hypothetical protein [Bradyrhizobium diazoefficiens]|uniref:hypothetical protein n=1 Tax=Bradyrhizobium diazoefficiens TaxID=1355477 RepID=UPI00272A11CE|nr:hypothetical protein [Bradyrhizobium diazoefficiens]WLA68566.1 hypothetical protein QNN01_19030 [Bradyrhizobium diazoefficiens]